MSTIIRSRAVQVLSKSILVVLCALCLQPLGGCASKSGEEGIIDYTIKYAYTRTLFDMAGSCVVGELPDAKVEISLTSLGDAPDGGKEIRLEPCIVSDTMASWSADEWAKNRDDLFFNFVAHFNVICKQAHEYGDVPEGYTVTCPDYVTVYNSQKDTGFIVSSTGVYQRTEDPNNPIGETIVLSPQD